MFSINKNTHSVFHYTGSDNDLNKLRYFFKICNGSKLLTAVDAKELYVFSKTHVNAYFFRFCLRKFYMFSAQLKNLNALTMRGNMYISNFFFKRGFSYNNNKVLLKIPSVFFLKKNIPTTAHVDLSNQLINYFIKFNYIFSTFASPKYFRRFVYRTTYVSRWDLYDNSDLLMEFSLTFDSYVIDAKNQLIAYFFKLFRNLVVESDSLVSSNKPVEDDFSDESIEFQKLEFAELFGYDSLNSVRSQFTKIQFKPGHPTFFRDLRRSYKWLNKLEFVYQWKLTRYLTKFRSMSSNDILRYQTFFLRDLLVKLHFASTTEQSKYLIETGRVSLNGLTVRDLRTNLQLFDYVQLECSYINYNNIYNQLLKRRGLIQYGFKLLDRYSSFIKRGDFGNEIDFLVKRRPSGFEKTLKVSSLLNLYYSVFDIPSCFEVDYLSLSCVVVYDVLDRSMFDYISIRKSAVGYLKMLNWKYLS